MNKVVLLAGVASIIALSGCDSEGVRLLNKEIRREAAVAMAPAPFYYLRPIDMEEAAEVCPEGEVEAVGVTTEPVVVLHIICQNGVTFLKDKATGRVFKKVST